MLAIHLLPLGDVPAGLLQRLVAPLEARFAALVLVDPPEPLRSEWLDPTQGACSADAILRALVATPPAEGGRRLAVLDGQVFTDGIEAAAGVSTIGGCCGILALGRLTPGAPDTAAGRDLLFQRALTEAVHELGHLAGLGHCPDEHCVMWFSRSIEDTDRKGPNFCARCRR